MRLRSPIAPLRGRRGGARAVLGGLSVVGLAAVADAPRRAGGQEVARAPQPAVGGGAPGAGSLAPATDSLRARVPWGVGERLGYEVKFGPVRVGSGSMEVAAVTSVRGREAYHTVFRVRGGTFFYKVNDVLESWIDTRSLSSLRFVKDQQEGGRDREVRYEIFPERTTFVEGGGEEERSVPQPLDDGSFLFYVRTIPLEVGRTYEVHRYFKPDRNPVRIRVLRRERVRVPAGTFDAVVVQPTFKAKGIFSEGGRAEVWLSDDADRIMLQMRSSLSFGTLHLALRSRQAGQQLNR